MTMIQAKVNPRLLGKAARLFTGTLSGRVIELLQNARRAGAGRVEISNRDGVVTVRDDGHGIDDFAKLLDLGGSGWEHELEESEDPAGVGLFCLAHRPVTIRSKHQIVTIRENGWTGAAVEVRPDPRPLPATPGGVRAGAGAELSFPDEPWTAEIVSPMAAFTGMDVTVDGERCPKEPFITGEASLYPDLGCRIKVVKETELTVWHRRAAEHREHRANVLVSFHGQVTAFSWHLVSDYGLNYLVELTGQPTALRLMLPARTRLIENDALGQLKAALEVEAYRYYQGQGHHRLPYKQWLRAKELGIELPEAQPFFQVGLLSNDMGPEPVEVKMPQGHSLAKCYRLANDRESGSDSDEANAHLLAALGRFDEPFVPIEIRSEYDGYAWSKLPTIERIEVTAGNMLQESWVSGGQLICVESLTITAHCSDGKTFCSAVPMAIKPPSEDAVQSWMADCDVWVTPTAQNVLLDSQIWFHLGGYNDEGDTYDTQEQEFQDQLDAFWIRLAGPNEALRRRLMDCTADLTSGWKSILIAPDGRVLIQHADGSEQSIAPSAASAAPSAVL